MARTLTGEPILSLERIHALTDITELFTIELFVMIGDRDECGGLFGVGGGVGGGLGAAGSERVDRGRSCLVVGNEGALNKARDGGDFIRRRGGHSLRRYVLDSVDLFCMNESSCQYLEDKCGKRKEQRTEQPTESEPKLSDDNGGGGNSGFCKHV